MMMVMLVMVAMAFMGMMGIVGVLIFFVVIIIIMVVMVMMRFFLVMMFFFVIVILVVMFAFHRFNPCSGGCHFVKVEHARVQDLVEVHVAVVTFDDVRLGLDGANNLLDACQLLRFHFGSLVEQDNVAELDLLDDQVLDVLFCNVGLLKRCT